MVKKVQFDPGAVLDRVISSAEPEDECYLYKLADFKKSGQLVDAFNSSGSKGLEDLVKKLGPLMYWNGKGELITRTEYMRWKFRNNEKETINVDESGMTQFDPLLSWEVNSKTTRVSCFHLCCKQLIGDVVQSCFSWLKQALTP